jgi:hypothetical protein
MTEFRGERGGFERCYSTEQMKDRLVLERTRNDLRHGFWRKGGKKADHYGRRCLMGLIQLHSESWWQYRRILRLYVRPSLPGHYYLPGAFVWIAIGHYNDQPERTREEMIVLTTRSLQAIDMAALSENPLAIVQEAQARALATAL